MDSPTEAQRRALEQLREVEGASVGTFDVLEASLHGDSFHVEVAVDCRPYERAEDGLPLRDRERFVIELQPDVPFQGPPTVTVCHYRWCGRPHVNWCRNVCLYLSPATEWDISAGMAGLVERLDRWLADAALNRLDPEDAPLHPPTAFPSSPIRIVASCDVPVSAGDQWAGFAVLDRSKGDLGNEWVGITEWNPANPGRDGAAALILSEPMPMEFPLTVGGLWRAIPESSRDEFGRVLRTAARRVPLSDALLVVIGTPMRRGADSTPRVHLAVWHLDREGHKALRAIGRGGDPERVRRRLVKWAETARVQWCPVHEARPEIVVSRDAETPMAAFRGKRVSVWGCGALGAHIALLLARAGVKSLVLYDTKVVTPGILVRQPFEASHIGASKAEALKDILSFVAPGLEVQAIPENVVSGPLARDDASDGSDLIIDATANRTVLAKIEDARLAVPVANVSVDASASRGLLLYTGAEHSGGPYDLSRRVKLEVTGDPALGHFAQAFFPTDPTDRLRQPEPGCSDPTFVGSAADASALAASLLNGLGVELAGGRSAAALAVTQPNVFVPSRERRAFRLRPSEDLILSDQYQEYEVRVSASAWADIQAWIRKSARVRNPRDETGGLLFGQVDEALRCVWVSDVSGPPPDSTHSPTLFVCGTEGTAQMNESKRNRTLGSVQFVGMWHSHPVSSPTPSPTDHQGTDTLFRHTTPPPRQSLLLIVGHSMTAPVPAAYLYRRPQDLTPEATPEGNHGDPLATTLPGAEVDDHALSDDSPATSGRKITVVLQGRNAHAIPYHVGVVRALLDFDLFDSITFVGLGTGGVAVGLVGSLGVEGALANIDELAVGDLLDHPADLQDAIQNIIDGGSHPSSDAPCYLSTPRESPIRVEASDHDVAEAIASICQEKHQDAQLTAAVLMKAPVLLWFGDIDPEAAERSLKENWQRSGPDWAHPAITVSSLYHEPDYVGEAPSDFVPAPPQPTPGSTNFDAEFMHLLRHRGEMLARFILPRAVPF